MAGKKLTVVISQAQGKNPAKRHLEEEIISALIMDPDIDASLVPNLYDMSHDHTGMLFLRSVRGDLLLLSWLYPRAARWILDRDGVRGHEGITLIKSDDDDEDDDDATAGDSAAEAPDAKGIGSVDVPNRKLYCIDLRASMDPDVYLDEIRRIAAEKSVQTVGLMDWIQGSPKPQQLQRYLQPEQMLAALKSESSGHAPPQGISANGDGANGNGANGNGTTAAKNNGQLNGNGSGAAAAAPAAASALADILPEPTKRRWYPVIDYSRCTNCMECIDFCLFGVYGVDQLDRILVEEQDNCKKGCPACSRVCPENAIIFPQHKTPAIAGADGIVGTIKIDLSKLFGGETGESPLDMAVRERDMELVADGRDAVGIAVGLPKRQPETATAKRDELDDLIDGLDGLDL